MIDAVVQDLRYAARSLRRTPGPAAAAILTLALGIGANTAIFTLLDAVMFKPLNVPAPHELIALYERPRQGEADVSGGTGRYMRFSYPRFDRLRQALGNRGSLAAMTRTTTFVVRFEGQRQPEPVRAQLVSAGYFDTLQVPPAVGRAVDHDEVGPASEAPIAVIGDRLWKERLGGGNVIGQTIVVSGVAATIVGILRPWSWSSCWWRAPTSPTCCSRGRPRAHAKWPFASPLVPAALVSFNRDWSRLH